MLNLTMISDRHNSATEHISIAQLRAIQGRCVTPQPQGRISATAYQRSAPEASIQQAITDWLTMMGYPHTITDASRAFGPDGKPRKSKVATGWPDISGCLPPSGRLFVVECKSPTGRFRPGQKPMLARLRSAGALVIVARCLEDVVKAINKGRSEDDEIHTIQ